MTLLGCLVLFLAVVSDGFLCRSKIRLSNCASSRCGTFIPRRRFHLLARKKLDPAFDVYEDELCESNDIATADSPDLLPIVNGEIDMDKLDKRFTRSRVYKQRFPANSRTWLEKVDKDMRTVLQEVKEYNKAFAQGDVQGYEGYYNPIDPHDMHEELKFPPDMCRKWFVCFASCPMHKLGSRGEAYLAHTQWVRRTAMLPHTTLAPNASVIHEFTALSQNKLYPIAQVLFLKANSSQAVLDYLAVEPLAVHGGITPWKVYQLSVPPEFSIDVAALPVSPHLFIGTLNTPPTSKTEELFNHSRTFHHLSGLPTSPFRLHNQSRVMHWGQLHEVNRHDHEEQREWMSDEAIGPVVGEVVVFNAHSNGDALRYLEQNPLLSTKAAYHSPYHAAVLHNRNITNVMEYTSQTGSDGGLDNPCGLELIYGVANIQDVDGFGHKMPKCYSEKVFLDSSTFLDPEDILRLDQCIFPPNSSLASKLPNHVRENKRILRLMHDNNMSFAYTRFDPMGVGVEVDRTTLAYKLSKVLDAEDIPVLFEELMVNKIPPWQGKAVELRILSLSDKPLPLKGEHFVGKTVRDLINYPPYTKAKLEKMMTQVIPFLDSEDEGITQPVLNPAFVKSIKAS